MHAQKTNDMNNHKFKLNETGNRSVFSLPDNYFEQLQSDLGARIDQDKPVQLRKPQRFSLRPLLYMAAMFVFLLFSIHFILQRTTEDNTSSTLTENKSTTPMTAEDYLIQSIGTYTISEYYIDPELFE